MNGSPVTWTNASLVAVDLEGSGAQDRDDEAILEVALVPLVAGLPHLPDSFETLINPQRPIGRHPWLSPGLTNTALNQAPTINEVAQRLTDMINGRYLVGHNVAVDWRLLKRRVPDLAPAGLIDTLRLARAVGASRRSLTVLLDDLSLTRDIHAIVRGGQPHRALWDATACAILLPALVQRHWGRTPSATELLAAAGIPTTDATSQPALF
ncbi:3'-5' exonuclease [Micromonospora tulbaghiae]|uniref:3'-5' exonuclease n=1 Tax=Micromonospora tulbaghiae TaxID=479978 RepID=UPI0033F62F71